MDPLDAEFDVYTAEAAYFNWLNGGTDAFTNWIKAEQQIIAFEEKPQVP